MSIFFEKATKLIIDTKKEILIDIYRCPLYNDEPKIFAYSAIYRPRYKNNTDIANGFSFTKKLALTKVLGELIERYCLDHYNPKPLLKSSKEKLSYPHLDPFCIVSFSKSQLKKKSFKEYLMDKTSRYVWVKGWSLTERKRKLIPKQLVAINYTKIKDEPIILAPISTGAAAGLSLNTALYRGICEVAERDAFLISYLNKLPSPKIDLASLKDKKIKKILHVFSRYLLELVVVDITTDLQIPAFVAIIIDQTGIGPAVSIGLKAGFNLRETIIGAIEEALMSRYWMRDKFIYKNLSSKKTEDYIELRAFSWFSTKVIKNLDFWLENKNIKKNLNLDSGSPNDNLKKATQLLKDKDIEILYVDLTNKKMKEYGFTVVKVIIPKLHPLYLNENYPYYGGNRLYDVPIKLGFYKKCKQEKELNKIPHPFL